MEVTEDESFRFLLFNGKLGIFRHQGDEEEWTHVAYLQCKAPPETKSQEYGRRRHALDKSGSTRAERQG